MKLLILLGLTCLATFAFAAIENRAGAATGVPELDAQAQPPPPPPAESITESAPPKEGRAVGQKIGRLVQVAKTVREKVETIKSASG